MALSDVACSTYHTEPMFVQGASPAIDPAGASVVSAMVSLKGIVPMLTAPVGSSLLAAADAAEAVISGKAVTRPRLSNPSSRRDFRVFMVGSSESSLLISGSFQETRSH